MARLVLMALLIVAAIALLMGFQPGHGPDRRSTVKVSVHGGHGSGVHIGGGHIVTAAHVTRGSDTVTIKTHDGREIEAAVLWESDEYDVALLQIEDEAAVPSAALSCRTPNVHEVVTAHGNPLSMERIVTRGWIAGDAFSIEGMWVSVVPMSIPLAGGMSGGGLYDAWGRVVGIVVGVPVQPIGYGATFTGISFAVPGSVICNLLARS